ncbi:MAG: hypothetical protein L0177_08335 [Chloroflexi bacterium]|nr:hypothetical protein [Chloroflexota bacterium]
MALKRERQERIEERHEAGSNIIVFPGLSAGTALESQKNRGVEPISPEGMVESATADPMSTFFTSVGSLESAEIAIEGLYSFLVPSWYEQLERRIAALEEELVALRAIQDSGDVIVLRTVTKEDAKEEIKKLFRTGETLYYSDISKRLGIELLMVVDICDELMEEGEIEIDGNYRDRDRG